MMTDILLTAVIPLLLIVLVKCGSKESPDNQFFMTKDYGVLMKGLCAIIVVLFHFPNGYQNPLQHFIGGFAFVAVTLFFLFSSYGMQLNVERNPSYLDLFWKKRLLSLLVPVFLINALFFLSQLLIKNNLDVKILFHVDEYVVVLLQYCFLFYIVNYLYKKSVLQNKKHVDALLISGVIISSLIVLFSLPSNAPSGENNWYVERYGLIWGLLVYRYFPKILQWLNHKRRKKIIISFVVSIIVLAAYHSLKYSGIGYRYLLEIFSAFLLIVLLFLLTQKRKYGNSIIKLLGNISFEIYLSHRYVMELLLILFPYTSSCFFIIMVFLVTLVFSYLVHFLCLKLLCIIIKKQYDTHIERE